MFSPSSGSLNSVGAFASVARRVGAAAFAGGCDGEAGLFSGDCVRPELPPALAAALWTLGAGSAGSILAFAVFSNVKITCPTLILSPCFTGIACTVPVTDDGTSTTALSVSSSITGCPSVTLDPGEIMSLTSSPCVMFSPSSGNLNSFTEIFLPEFWQLLDWLTIRGIRFVRIDPQVLHGVLQILQ